MQSLESAPIVATIAADTRGLVGDAHQKGVVPQLAIVQVLGDEASDRYIRAKQKAAKELGVMVSHYQLDAAASFEEVQSVVTFLATDDEVHGIIIQLPLPKAFSSQQVDKLIKLIPVAKDVDALRGDWKVGSGPLPTLQQLLQPTSDYLPPMVLGVLATLAHYNIHPEQLHTAMLGAGRLVGAPLARYFGQRGWSVAAVTEDTPNSMQQVQQAQLVITGTGEPDLLTYQWVQEGVVVLNAANDVHEASVAQVASAMSPATGGLGPLTVAFMLHNVALAAQGGQQ